ncbi:MAG: glycosyltransferase [Thermosphaera sp.]
MVGKKKICIVSDDFIGPIRNGGIGTACTSLGETFAQAGHEVTLLFTLGNYTETKSVEQWISWYREKNIQFIPFPENYLGIKVEAPFHISRSFEVYHWLKGKNYDLIYFPEWRGRGYYSILAKHQGLAFQHTILCVGIHSPTLWERQGSHEYLNQLDQVEIDFMERQCVALADVVISPSQYMLDWVSSEGWELPPNSIIRQNILPKNLRKVNIEKIGSRITPREIIFFGRLYTRKGLVLFCDALDLVTSRTSVGLEKVSFLGKSVEVDGLPSEEYIHKRAKRWPWKVNIITNLDQQEALQYIHSSEGLVIIASLMENSPYTILECLGAGIPFLTSNVGGIPELIHENDRDAVCFTPKASHLSEKIVQALKEGVLPAKPAIPFEETERSWLEWVETLSPLPLSRDNETQVDSEMPLVSICLTHYNRPQYLRQALNSLRNLTYPKYEVILVDDGSNKLEALYYLKTLEPYFHEKGWKIIRQSNRYLGAARNTAAKHAQGNYLLFMDDDNIAKPNELDILTRVAKKTEADIVTCAMDLFSGDDPPKKSTVYWIPLGPSITAGAFRNCFGDANALIRKDVFWSLGGFSEDYGIGHEDWEFFSKAVLHGYKLEVIPEALYFYRQSTAGMLRSGVTFLNHRRNIRPYLEAVDPRLRQLILFAQGQKYLIDVLLSSPKGVDHPSNRESDLIADALALKALIDPGISNLNPTQRLGIVKNLFMVLSSLQDLKLKLIMLLVCGELLMEIREYVMAMETFEEAQKLSDLLKEHLTSQNIIQRKIEIQEKYQRKQRAQVILQEILTSEDPLSTLETYQSQISIDLVDELHDRAQKALELGDQVLAEEMIELGEYLISKMKQ